MEHIITGISKNSLKVTFVTNSTHFDKMMRFGNLIEDLQCENGRQRILETLFPSCRKHEGLCIVDNLSGFVDKCIMYHDQEKQKQRVILL